VTSAGELRGLRVLVVEDEFLVSMDIELMLRELRCQVVGPIGDLETALRAAQEQTFDLALLDVNIGGQPVTAVADALAARAVPFVLCTGYRLDPLSGRYPAAPKLMKPFQIGGLSEALRSAAALASRPQTRS
jgi:DNA-binding NarL/FixJ family response regulator